MSDNLLSEVIRVGELARGAGSGYVLTLPPSALDKTQGDITNLADWLEINQSVLDGATLQAIEGDVDRQLADTYALALEIAQASVIQASAIPAHLFDAPERASGADALVRLEADLKRRYPRP